MDVSTPERKVVASAVTPEPHKPGSALNRTGINGYTAARRRLRSFMLDYDRSVPGSKRKRFDALIEATYENATQGGKDGAVDRKLLFAYIAGKEPKSPEDAQLDLAEHFRKVETDRFAFALQLLGTRLGSMSDKEKGDFFNSLVVAQKGSVEMFVRMAAGAADPSSILNQEPHGQVTALPDSDPTPKAGVAADESEPKP